MASTWAPGVYFRAASVAEAASSSSAAPPSSTGERKRRAGERADAGVDGASNESNDVPVDRATAATAATAEPTVVEVEMLDDNNSEPFYALIVLNQPLVTGFRSLWRRASVRICADGGANHLYDGLDEADRERLLPSFIKGDLDSLRQDVAQYYQDRNVPVIQDHDQETTDLIKCMDELEAWERRTDAATHPVFICGALSGRFDHILHSVHFLHRHTDGPRQVFLVSNENIAFLLGKGQHRILVDATTEGPTCGIMPFAGPAVISTTGLQWNMGWFDAETCALAPPERALCSFGGLMSTSNALVEPVVLVETDAPVVWTIERNPAGL